MDALKKIFPLSWKYTKDVANLLIGIIIYIVVGIVAGVVILIKREKKIRLPILKTIFFLDI